MSLQYGKLQPILAAEIVSLDWGTTANFKGFCVLASLLQRRRSPEANQTLHDVWPSPGLYIYTHSRGLLPQTEFRHVQKSLYVEVQCVLLYWQRYCTALQQRASAKLCGLVLPNFCRGAAYIRLGGHHVGHRPTYSSSFFPRLISAVADWMSYHTSTHDVVLVRI